MKKASDQYSLTSSLSITTLKGVFILAALGVLAICIASSISIMTDPSPDAFEELYPVYIVVISLYLTTTLFIYGLVTGWKLLNLIGSNQIYTNKATKSLQIISKLALTITIIFSLDLPFFYWWAGETDAPGLIIIGIVLALAPLAVSAIAYLFSEVLSQKIRP